MGTPKAGLQHSDAAKARRALDRLLPRRLEKHEQADSVAALEAVGAKVYVFGTRRRQKCHACGAVTRDQGTRQTPGPADILAFLPAPKRQQPQQTRLIAVWIEMKREEGGRLSPPQEEFKLLCEMAAQAHIVARGVKDVIEYLTVGGWIRDRNCR